MSVCPFDVIPKLSINPDQINLYSEVIWNKSRPKRERIKNLGDTDKLHHGKVSVHTRRKVGKATEYLLFMANDKYLPNTAHGRNYKFKIAFITLTLPSSQIHSDNEIKDKCLNQMLIEMRRIWKVKNYIWRAEKQKNGNIHFHILVDKFIPWSELRDRWNRITNKLGYVDRYRNQMLQFHSGGFKVRQDLLKSWAYKKQVKAYKAGKANDFTSPNSTDIHSLFRISKVKSYILKYCTKDEKNQEVEGRMWGCSESLSHIKGGQAIATSSLKSEIDKLAKMFHEKVYQGDYCTVMHISIFEVYQAGCTELYKLFACYMFEQFNFNVQTVMSQ
jgi:hypothetical protein